VHRFVFGSFPRKFPGRRRNIHRERIKRKANLYVSVRKLTAKRVRKENCESHTHTCGQPKTLFIKFVFERDIIWFRISSESVMRGSHREICALCCAHPIYCCHRNIVSFVAAHFPSHVFISLRRERERICV